MNALPFSTRPSPTTYALADRQPQQVVQPTSIADVSELLAEATRTHTAVVPWGGGTHQFLLDPPQRYDIALDLRQLNRVIEYQPADLVITVEAGASLGSVQALLRERGQWLPWDPPASDAATIGGLLATAAWGPLRLGYGGPREWLLGMQVVLGDGRVVQSGGRVVKNVAGYDTHKLHLGAYGTLGVMATATFKVAPLPETFVSLRVTCSTVDEAWQVAEVLRRPPLQPVGLVITISDTIMLQAHFAGVAAAVERQLALATAACSDVTDLTVEHDYRALHHAAYPHASATGLILRIGVPDSALPVAMSALATVTPESVTVFPGLGLIIACCPQTTATHLPVLRQALAGAGGYAVVEYSPVRIERWGPPPPTIDLMRALRQRWDPAGILNPGRWLIE
ncbi:MAG: FAD-binding oxidoreductase [Chloroflexus sp.]|uniref:FAD-binding oxidoreductase n=1 Tax=Chloroflexus sp. TaxID=1904827 RepID=UPI0030AD9365